MSILTQVINDNKLVFRVECTALTIVHHSSPSLHGVPLSEAPSDWVTWYVSRDQVTSVVLFNIGPVTPTTEYRLFDSAGWQTEDKTE